MDWSCSSRRRMHLKSQSHEKENATGILIEIVLVVWTF
jgi:hypothetical protein